MVPFQILDLGLEVRIDGVIPFLRFHGGEQQPVHAVGGGKPPGRHQVVPQDGTPAVRILGQQPVQTGKEGGLRRDGEPLHHARIAGKVLAEVIQGPKVLPLQRFGECRRVDAAVQELGGLQVTAGLGIQVPEKDGSLVVAVGIIQRAKGQFLAMLQVLLGGIETEREIFRGDVHLQIELPPGIGRGAREFAESVHLVLLAGDMHVPGGHVAVQFPEHSPGV